MSLVKSKNGTSYLVPFILVTSLFFLWGFAHSFLDVLNKHFQEVLVISKARSGLVQAMVYGGYFLMALPAGMIIRKWGYRAGVVLGLLLYGIGALMFVPGAKMMSFPFFLLCLFIIGCGLTCLETSANPYVTVLGDPDAAARRLNLAQSFNGLGWIVGPFVGGLLVLGEDSNIALPYAVVGTIVLVLGFVFSRVHLPEVGDATATQDVETPHPGISLWKITTFTFGVAALFLYVAAQTGINSFFINFVTESDTSISAETAALLLSLGGMGLFMFGRLFGTFLMKYVKPAKLVLVCAIGAAMCMGIVMMNLAVVSIVALCLTYLFESIMFPTIFSMAIANVHGPQTKTASSILIMSIVGGAISPIVMGLIGETSMAVGFALPLICFVCIGAYSWFILKSCTKKIIEK
ncbi:MAG: sugar MFS transporter [Prevotella sp.]